MIRYRLKVEPEEPYLWPGPGWEPVVHDGIFPLVAEPGDLYINRHRDPPLYYFFDSPTNCELVPRQEILTWVIGGLMMRPTPAQSPVQHSPRSAKPTRPMAVE